MSAKKIGLLELFDADLDGLLSMRGAFFDSPSAEIYHRILLAYHQCDVQGMLQAKRESTDLLIQNIAEIRIQIRVGKFVPALIDDLKSVADSDQLWGGEMHFVISSVTAAMEDHEGSLFHSLRAAQLLKKVGARRKAVRALLNAVASESTLRPEKHYISDLYHILKEAKSAGDHPAIGITLMNLSRQYQKLGCHLIALKFANRAIRLLQLNAGKLDYQTALAHRCHLHCQLGRFSEARLDWEQAKCCSFSEVHAALQLIGRAYPILNQAEQEHANQAQTKAPGLLPMWKERLGERAPESLSKSEQKVIELLCEKPRSRVELVALLYGTRLSAETLENRFYNLMNRIRKRHPELIGKIDGKYRLNEPAILPELKKKAG